MRTVVGGPYEPTPGKEGTKSPPTLARLVRAFSCPYTRAPLGFMYPKHPENLGVNLLRANENGQEFPDRGPKAGND